MPSEDTKPFGKEPFIIYADLQCSKEKLGACENNTV